MALKFLAWLQFEHGIEVSEVVVRINQLDDRSHERVSYRQDKHIFNEAVRTVYILFDEIGSYERNKDSVEDLSSDRLDGQAGLIICHRVVSLVLSQQLDDL